MAHLVHNKHLIMHSVHPTSLFLIIFVQICTGRDLSLPSLPEAVQLLQLESIRGLEQTILAKEDENRRLEETILAKEDENQRLEEIIESVKIEKEAVTRQNTMMEEELVQIISERESVIGEQAAISGERWNNWRVGSQDTRS